MGLSTAPRWRPERTMTLPRAWILTLLLAAACTDKDNDPDCVGDDCDLPACDDADADGVCDADDQCAGDDATGDADGDGTCDDLDGCDGDDAAGDADSDGICDDLDVCTGTDATGDADADGVCDDADLCAGDDATGDADTDGVCDDADLCTGTDATGDADADGVCDDLDLCAGDDATGDADTDGVCDDADLCAGDDGTGDADTDGVCDDADLCTGDDATGDADTDGVCDDLDVCAGDDATGDDDGDAICNVLDLCAGDDATGDTDGDAVCDDRDVCDGDDATGDADTDGVCDDLDACLGDDALGDADTDGVCDDRDQCVGDDAIGDADVDGTCDDRDLCLGDDALGDTDADGICDDRDVCDGDDATGDADGDGLCNDSDTCSGDDTLGDADVDGICDDLDVCTGDDATGDDDTDSVCNDLDVCLGDDATDDLDGDGTCGDRDQCDGDDATGDTDIDGVCDDLDVCDGDDTLGDADIDGVCDDLDVCDGDDATGDADGDAVCDDLDVCDGDDATGDADSDGVCDDLDLCSGDDAFGDADGDGLCDVTCVGDLDAGDTDGDGVCDDLDACAGDDATGDADGDGICDDLDVCLGTDALGDSDGDGSCDDADLCIGDDTTGDTDNDGTCDELETCDPVAPCNCDSTCDNDTCVPWPESDFDNTCERLVAPDDIELVEQCRWTGPPPGDPYPDHTHVMSTPVVVDFDFDEDPTTLKPSIVVATFPTAGIYFTAGRLRVLDGETCEQQLTIEGDDTNIMAPAGPAVGDIDGDGRAEIVAARQSGGLAAFDYDAATGSFDLLWLSRDCSNGVNDLTGGINQWAGPSIHDLDDDGVPEILYGGTLYGADGCLLSDVLGYPNYNVGVVPVVADVDEDGEAELVMGDGIYRWDAAAGDLVVESWSGGGALGQVALADFGDYPVPSLGGADFVEVVVVSNGEIRVQTLDGTVVHGPWSMPGGGVGGPPTVADFDGDGAPEIGVAAEVNYAVFDPDCVPGGVADDCASGTVDGVLWTQPAQDGTSNATGSSVFDFDANGAAEAVYADECFLRVYDGATGDVISSIARSSGTTYENPVIVDVDGDLAAEVVTAVNDYSGTLNCPTNDPLFPSATFSTNTGVLVLRDVQDRWAATRPVWNQHAYAVTNVGDRGEIPRTSEVPLNWQDPTLNNFRQNTPGGLRALGIPDLTVRCQNPADLVCDGTDAELTVEVCNRGSLPRAPGSQIAFLDGPNGAELCRATMTNVITIGGCTMATCTAPIPTGDVYVVADPDDALNECDEDNNRGVLRRPSCLP
jgi:hypothetical protein